jgi:transcriptional regulator with XRE-family HTH domain
MTAMPKRARENNPRKFGEIIKELRKAQNLRQSDLAQLIIDEEGEPIGTSTIALIESHRAKLPAAVLVKVIKVLTADRELQASLIKMIDAYNESVEEKNLYPRFSRVLNAAISDFNLNMHVVSKGAGVSSNAMRKLVEGLMLPSGDLLLAISKVLHEHGAPAQRIKELEKAFVYEAILNMRQLKYLSITKRKAVAEATALAI